MKANARVSEIDCIHWLNKSEPEAAAPRDRLPVPWELAEPMVELTAATTSLAASNADPAEVANV